MLHEEKTTKELDFLLNNCKSSKELDELVNFTSEKSFASYFRSLCIEKNVNIASLPASVNISKPYIYAIAEGKKNKVSRVYVLRIGIGIGCTLSEMNRLLKLAGYRELYSKNKADQVIIFGLQNNFSIEEIDKLLIDRGINTVQLLD